MEAYLPILVFILVAFGFPVVTILFLTPLLRPSKPETIKLEPYECGIEAKTFAFDRPFTVRYYLVAVLFVVFEVETVFLFPWAIHHIGLGWFGFLEMFVFLVILFIGYWYALRRRALDFASAPDPEGR